MKPKNSLNSEQAKFFTLLEQFNPSIQNLWDIDERGYKPDMVAKYLAVASSQEAIIVRFLLGVWSHENEFDFDLFSAVKYLDTKQLAIIKKWINDPFLP